MIHKPARRPHRAVRNRALPAVQDLGGVGDHAAADLRLFHGPLVSEYRLATSVLAIGNFQCPGLNVPPPDALQRRRCIRPPTRGGVGNPFPYSAPQTRAIAAAPALNTGSQAYPAADGAVDDGRE